MYGFISLFSLKCLTIGFVVQQNFKAEPNSLSCRFYENQYPEPEEVVMVNVTNISDMGAYVTLLEYDDIEVSFVRVLCLNKLKVCLVLSGDDFAVRAVQKTHSVY